MNKARFPEALGEVVRQTRETDIRVKVSLYGSGYAQVHTGIGFFDHLLESFARHGFFDLEVEANGDLHVDGHHTVEDVGICIGAALRKALDNTSGLVRFGDAAIPMDDALVTAAVDVSGRAYLGFQLSFQNERIGQLDTCLIKEFFRGLVSASKINLHFVQLAGDNDHHIAEAAFKAFAKSLDKAVSVDERVEGVLSTKGKLREDWD